MNDRLKQKMASLQADPKRAAAPGGAADRVRQYLTSLKANPRRAVVEVGGGVLVLVVLGILWGNRSVETWLEVEPAEMRLTAGASQSVAVTLMRKPRFRSRGSAAPSQGTIQLISFPRAVDVAPTTLVTTDATPRAQLKVTGLRAGEEELIFAGSSTPSVEASWQTLSMRVVVSPRPAAPAAPARRR